MEFLVILGFIGVIYILKAMFGAMFSSGNTHYTKETDPGGVIYHQINKKNSK